MPRICVTIFPFAIVANIVTELKREVIFSLLPYGDDFILISEIIEKLKNEIRKWIVS